MRTICIGLSGCSSSGKTSLAYAIKEILPNTIIIQQDSFYRKENEVPVTNGYKNWDCEEAIDFNQLLAAISEAKHGVHTPTNYERLFSNSKAEWLSKEVVERSQQLLGSIQLIIVEGFLLFHNPLLLAEFDNCLLLCCTHEELLERRKNKLWTEVDEPEVEGYFERIVYPAYQKYEASVTGIEKLHESPQGLNQLELLEWTVSMIALNK